MTIYDNQGNAIETPCNINGVTLPEHPADEQILATGCFRSIQETKGEFAGLLPQGLTLLRFIKIEAPTMESLIVDLKTKREAVEFGTLTFMNKIIQVDRDSRMRISATAAAAEKATDEQWGYEFPGWRCADDTMLQLTRAQMIELGLVTAQHSGNVFAVYAIKRAQIEANEPCDINSGWPQ